MSFFFRQKCMETKNTILARQKEMQLSLAKVKHLIRLIQVFNFNQALAETEVKDISARGQDSTEGAVSAEAAPEANSVENMKAGSSSANSSNNGNDQQEERGAAGNSQTAAGDSDSQAVLEDSTALTAENSPGLEPGGKAEPAVGAGGGGGAGLQAEALAKPETKAALVSDIPASSGVATVATTNGTAEPACSDRSPAGGCTTNSENKMAAVNPPETGVEKKLEEITDSDGSNNNNSKTSEPSQHSLPVLVSSLDNKK